MRCAGDKARDIFIKSKLPFETLGQIWCASRLLSHFQLTQDAGTLPTRTLVAPSTSQTSRSGCTSSSTR